MLKNNWLGSKTGQGFYKKEKVDGANQFFALDLKNAGIQTIAKGKIRIVLETTKTVDSMKDRLKILFAAKDKAGDFYRNNLLPAFCLCQQPHSRNC
jgi:3-hydroxyacyl-CoA dehydrogenase